MIAKHKKTVAAVIGALLSWGTVVVDSAPAAPTAGEWLALGFGLAGALGVYAAKNTTG